VSADTPPAFAAMTLLSVISVLLFYVLVVLEHLLLPWSAGDHGLIMNCRWPPCDEIAAPRVRTWAAAGGKA
jgi:hypothetical protein